MAGVKVYEATQLPGTPSGPTATPDMFGAGVGRAMEQLGKSQIAVGESKLAVSRGLSEIGSAANNIAEQVYAQQTRQDVTDGDKIISDGKLYFQNRLAQLQTTTDPGDRDTYTKVMKEVHDYFDSRSQGITTRGGQESFNRAVENAKLSIGDQAIALQANMLGQHAVNQGNAILENYSTIVSRDPTQIDASRAALTKDVQNPDGVFANMPSAAREKYLNEGLRKLDVQAVNAIAQQDPNSILSKIPAETKNRLANAANTQADTKPGLPPSFGGEDVKAYTQDQINSRVSAINKPTQWDKTIEAAAQKYNLDPREIKMRMAAESNFDPNAVSNKNAGGIMQLTPDTAAGLGVDRFNPTQSIFGAAKLIRQYTDEAKGDTAMVDMLYYAGPNRAQWGNNTKQYAANLAAVRQAAGLGASRAPMDLFNPGSKMVDDGVPKTPTGIPALDRLDGPEYFDAINRAHHYQRMYQTEEEGSRIKQNQVKKDEQAALFDGYFRRIMAPTPENGGEFSITQVINDGSLEADTRAKIVGAWEAKVRQDASAMKKDDPDTVKELYTTMFTNSRSEDQADLAGKAYDAFISGKINQSTYNYFRENDLRSKNEFGQTLQQVMGRQMNSVWQQFTAKTMFKYKQDQFVHAYQLWSQDFESAVSEARKNGENPNYLWDVRDKRNMISPEAVSRYMPTSKETLAGGAKDVASNEVAAAAKALVPNETRRNGWLYVGGDPADKNSWKK